MGIEDIRDALVIREGAIFILTDPGGNVPPGNEQGFGVYQADTRHLSAFDLTLNGTRPVMLLSTAELGYAMEQVMTNPTLQPDGERTVQRGTIEIRRVRVIADVIEETLRLTNFNPFPVTLHLLFEVSADFADIFDVRGYEREKSGQFRAPEVGTNSILYRYTGIDGRDRSTLVEFDRKPDYLDESTALFRVTLPRRRTISLKSELSLGIVGQRRKPLGSRADNLREEYQRWLEGCTQISTDNEFFNRVLSRAVHDVRMLRSETQTGEAFPAAGTPWFDALFGRDSCIMAMQTLPYRPELARGAGGKIFPVIAKVATVVVGVGTRWRHAARIAATTRGPGAQAGWSCKLSG